MMKERFTEVDQACARLADILYETRGMGRRALLSALAKAAVGSALLSTLGSVVASKAEAEEKPVTAFVFGGVWKKAITEAAGNPFTAKTGIPVRYQEPYNFARLRAMHEAKAQQIDAVSIQGSEIILADRLKMTTPLDWSVIDRSVLSEQQLRHPNSIGAYSLALVLAYNKKKWPGEDHPKSWADFWNVEKFPGRRSLRRDPSWTLEAALFADGATEEGFYPLDVDRAFRSLDRIKPHVKTWWSDNSQAQQLMGQEEVDLISMMDGRATETILHDNAPYAFIWNQGISTGAGQGWIVPAGGPNPQGAMKFMDFVGRPETLATFARLLYYAPLNLKAYDLIDPALAKYLSSYPENSKALHVQNYEWWADNLSAVQQRFESWLQS
jgi:putative spermidine/putrescine transport system substrate-binding protein